MIGYINGANLKEFMKNSNGTKDLKLLSANVRMRKATGSICTASSTDPERGLHSESVNAC